MDDNTEMKIVYTITERGTKSFWTKIGTAHVNRDGSLTVKLDALPISGEMHIRDYWQAPADSKATEPK